MAAIRCFYSCPACGITRCTVSVEERNEDQSLIEWLDTVLMPAFDVDHYSKQPKCNSEKFTEIGIPVYDEDTPIGSNPLS
jgi:hypothetical protein